jgi:hypothetical protein
MKVEVFDLRLELNCPFLSSSGCPFTSSCELTHITTSIAAQQHRHIVHAAEYGLNKSCICRTQLINNGIYSALNGAD